MPKKGSEDEEVDFEKLAKVMDFIKSGEFQKIVQDFMSGDSEKYKDLANLRNVFASKVFDWDNDETKKPARDAFLKLTKGYDQLSKTFNFEQKEIADQTDFKESVTELVLSMREQIEHFKHDAKGAEQALLDINSNSRSIDRSYGGNCHIGHDYLTGQMLLWLVDFTVKEIM